MPAMLRAPGNKHHECRCPLCMPPRFRRTPGVRKQTRRVEERAWRKDWNL